MDHRFVLLIFALFSIVGTSSASSVRAPGGVDTAMIMTPSGNVLLERANPPSSTQPFCTGQVRKSFKSIVNRFVAPDGNFSVIRAFGQPNRHGDFDPFIFDGHAVHSPSARARRLAPSVLDRSVKCQTIRQAA